MIRAGEDRTEAQVPLLRLLQPLEQTYVVSGARERWLEKCRTALAADAAFSHVEASEALFEVTAKYWRPPVWGGLDVRLLPGGDDSTQIKARASVRPNLFSVFAAPERRILARFSKDVGC